MGSGEVIKTPGGFAIVCSRGRRRKPARCSECSAEAPFLCDGPAPGGRTCDRPLCLRHATRVSAGRDLCPKCLADPSPPAPLGPGEAAVPLDDVATNSRIRIWSSFLGPKDALQLYHHLFQDSASWREEPGRRRTVAFGEDGLVYHYSGSGRNARAAAWDPMVRQLRELLRELLPGQVFNFALVTLYRDGMVGLGYHADNEPDLVPGAIIASVSLGQERDFYVRPEPNPSGGPPLSIRLPHGSLLTMEGDFQRHYVHAVPYRKACKLPRMNLTFRHVRAP